MLRALKSRLEFSRSVGKASEKRGIRDGKHGAQLDCVGNSLNGAEGGAVHLCWGCSAALRASAPASKHARWPVLRLQEEAANTKLRLVCDDSEACVGTKGTNCVVCYGPHAAGARGRKAELGTRPRLSLWRADLGVGRCVLQLQLLTSLAGVKEKRALSSCAPLGEGRPHSPLHVADSIRLVGSPLTT
ncbi:hypothetical protein MRX96_015147 [Rhipicephalus microplus]